MKIKILNVRTFLCCLLAAGTVSFVSCTGQKKDETKETKEIVIERDSEGNITDFKVYSYEQKDDVVRAAEEELDRMNKQIDEMKASLNDKSEELSAEAKAAYEEAIADLEKSRDDYQAKIDELKNSSENTWEQAKA
ncbi:MAG TPA: hypothetical protein PLV98_06395, partial [Dysgonamonadaceae bacterium]|nr:hypothetical protein [Dysgonamonadaceae bacterium]